MPNPSDLRETLRERIDTKATNKSLNMQLGVENIKRHSWLNKMSNNKLGESSVLSGSVEDPRLNDGKPTLVPFLYKGRRLPPDGREAVEMALASGVVWPAFETNDAASVKSIAISAGLGMEKAKKE